MKKKQTHPRKDQSDESCVNRNDNVPFDEEQTSANISEQFRSAHRYHGTETDTDTDTDKDIDTTW